MDRSETNPLYSEKYAITLYIVGWVIKTFSTLDDIVKSANNSEMTYSFNVYLLMKGHHIVWFTSDSEN